MLNQSNLNSEFSIPTAEDWLEYDHEKILDLDYEYTKDTFFNLSLDQAKDLASKYTDTFWENIKYMPTRVAAYYVQAYAQYIDKYLLSKKLDDYLNVSICSNFIGFFEYRPDVFNLLISKYPNCGAINTLKSICSNLQYIQEDVEIFGEFNLRFEYLVEHSSTAVTGWYFGDILEKYKSSKYIRPSSDDIKALLTYAEK